MTTKELILQELEQLPEKLLKAILDFLISLRAKQPQTENNNLWMQFVGILDDTEAKEMQNVVARKIHFQ